jgi:hypothetical protein
MSIERQSNNHVTSQNIQLLTGIGAQEIEEEVDQFFCDKQRAPQRSTRF